MYLYSKHVCHHVAVRLSWRAYHAWAFASLCPTASISSPGWDVDLGSRILIVKLETLADNQSETVEKRSKAKGLPKRFQKDPKCFFKGWNFLMCFFLEYVEVKKMILVCFRI